MSVSRTVYLRRSNMPTPEAWAKAIRAAGFPIDIDTDFDAESFSGFLPCRYDGQESGFEYFVSTVAERKAEDEGLETTGLGDRDVGVSFVTHSSLRELAAAVAAAGVLCAQADGVLHDEESDERVSASNALVDAREMIASIGEDLD